MRHFDIYEQRLIIQVITHAENNTYILTNLYNSVFLSGDCRFEGDSIFWKKFKSNDNDCVERGLNFEREIYRISFLIDDLLEEKYIYCIEDGNEDISILGNLTSRDEREWELVSKKLSPIICDIIKKSGRRVLVTENLRQLVRNNFLSVEGKMLQTALDEQEAIKVQCQDLDKLVDNAKLQTAEIRKQTKKITEQTQEAHKQTAEALVQTTEAQKQTTAALNQTAEAKKQTDEALKQTAEAQKQTWWAIGATAASFVALVCSIIVLCISKNQAQQDAESNTQVINHIDTIQSSVIEQNKMGEQVLVNQDSTIYLLNNISKKKK